MNILLKVYQIFNSQFNWFVNMLKLPGWLDFRAEKLVLSVKWLFLLLFTFWITESVWMSSIWISPNFTVSQRIQTNIISKINQIILSHLMNSSTIESNRKTEKGKLKSKRKKVKRINEKWRLWIEFTIWILYQTR